MCSICKCYRTGAYNRNHYDHPAMQWSHGTVLKYRDAGGNQTPSHSLQTDRCTPQHSDKSVGRPLTLQICVNTSRCHMSPLQIWEDHSVLSCVDHYPTSFQTASGSARSTPSYAFPVASTLQQTSSLTFQLLWRKLLETLTDVPWIPLMIRNTSHAMKYCPI